MSFAQQFFLLIFGPVCLALFQVLAGAVLLGGTVTPTHHLQNLLPVAYSGAQVSIKHPWLQAASLSHRLCRESQRAAGNSCFLCAAAVNKRVARSSSLISKQVCF